MDVRDLSTVNAVLNFTSFLLIMAGYRQIKKGNRLTHKRYMLSAFCVSVLFLLSYLYYHSQVGSVRFTGEGWIRPVYFTILISHTILAAALAPMAIVTVVRGLKGRYDLHKKISKKTFYVWSYVSLSGVLVYVLVYHLYR